METLLYLAERAIAFVNGKGYGAKTIAKEVSCVKRFCKGGTFFDVGANKGAYTAELLRQFGSEAQRIYCFEPARVLADALRFEDERVCVVNAALGGAAGTAVLYGTDRDSGLSSLTKRKLDHLGVQMEKIQDVTVTTLDEFAASRNIDQIDHLKLDVEGHEFEILEGANKLLSRNRVRCIQFEFGGCNIDTRTYFRDFWYLLRVHHSFDIFRIGPLGLIKVSKYREMDESFLTTNYIAAKAA